MRGLPLTPRLLERDAELEAIDRLLDAAAGGDGGLLLVEGVPGVGKTAILRAARDRARNAGFTVLSARGSALETGFAFGVVRQLLEPAVAAAGPERDALLGGAAGLAAAVFAGTAGPANTADPGFATLHGLYWLVANLAERGPLLLLVDDLHWTDAASLRFLAFLANRSAGLALALVGATRPMARMRGRMGSEVLDLLDRLEADHPHAVLRPTPLTRDAAGALAGPMPEAVVTAAFTATGGNPFLLLEMLAELRSRDATTAEDVAAVRPERIVAAIVGRVDRLGPAAGALCAALAVLGDADPLVLDRFLGDDVHAARDVAEALELAGVLRGRRPLAFAHPLVEAAVRDRLDPAWLADAHRRAADLLAEAGAAPEAIALHLLKTPPAQDPATVAHLREAARLALRRGAAPTAVDLYRRAIAENAAGDESALLRELGAACADAGDPVGARIELERAHELATDPRRRGEIALRLGEVLLMLDDSSAAVAVFSGALAELGEDPALADVAGRLLGSLLVLALYTPTSRRRTLGRLDDILALIEDDTPLPAAFLATASAELGIVRATAPEAAALALRAAAAGVLAETSADFAPPYLACMTLWLAGRYADARAICVEALADARRRGSLIGFAVASGQLALIDLRTGRLSEASGHADAITGAGHPVPPHARVMALAVQLHCRVLADDLRDDPVPEPAVDPDWLMCQLMWTAIARLRLAQGRPLDALVHLDRVARWERDWGGGTGAWTEHRRLQAEAHHQLGDVALARACAADELTLAERFGSAPYLGAALLTAAQVGLPDREDLLRRAERVLARSESRLLHGRAFADLGAFLVEAGRMDEAGPVLDRAREAAAAVGSERLERRVAEALVASGKRPGRRAPDPRLTPAEQRVAQHAANGASNREIAQQLFVTPKTVEAHLSSVYRKLGISSRSQLGDRL